MMILHHGRRSSASRRVRRKRERERTVIAETPKQCFNPRAPDSNQRKPHRC